MQATLDKESGLYRAIGKITDASIEWMDRDYLVCYLSVDYGGRCQVVGGFALSSRWEDKWEAPPATLPHAMDMIVRIMHACGVNKWEKVSGRTVFFLWPTENTHNAMPIGLENLPTEPGGRFLFKDILESSDN